MDTELRGSLHADTRARLRKMAHTESRRGSFRQQTDVAGCSGVERFKSHQNPLRGKCAKKMLLPGLPRDQFSGPWLFRTAEARTINSPSSKMLLQIKRTSALDLGCYTRHNTKDNPKEAAACSTRSSRITIWSEAAVRQTPAPLKRACPIRQHIRQPPPSPCWR